MPSGNSVIDEAIASAIHLDPMDTSGEPPYERWPILVRLAVIIGLSALLWAGIFWCVMALIG